MRNVFIMMRKKGFKEGRVREFRWFNFCCVGFFFFFFYLSRKEKTGQEKGGVEFFLCRDVLFFVALILLFALGVFFVPWGRGGGG